MKKITITVSFEKNQLAAIDNVRKSESRNSYIRRSVDEKLLRDVVPAPQEAAQVAERVEAQA